MHRVLTVEGLALLLAGSLFAGCVCEPLKARPLSSDGSCWEAAEEVGCQDQNSVAPQEPITARDADGHCWRFSDWQIPNRWEREDCASFDLPLCRDL